MKKKLLTVLMAMCAAAASAWAGNGVWVERLDGTKQGFLFTDNLHSRVARHDHGESDSGISVCRCQET